MNSEKTTNLTSGPILKTLVHLALPIMVSSFLGTAYNITDMIWVGQLGAEAFSGANKLNLICYNGTRANWKNVSKEAGVSSTVSVHCVAS